MNKTLPEKWQRLSHKAVDTTLMDCLPGLDELPEDITPYHIVSGMMATFVLLKTKIEEHKGKILEMLTQFPSQFYHAPGGGMGWSFLQMCVDHEGRQWGEHRQMQALIALGMAVGAVRYTVEDRILWEMMPGGVPYITIELPETHYPLALGENYEECVTQVDGNLVSTYVQLNTANVTIPPEHSQTG